MRLQVKRGPKSAAELNVVKLDLTNTRPKITPPSSLNAAEKALFNEVVRNNAHLLPGDALLIGAFVQALAKANKLAKKSDAASIASWEKVSRVMIALATKLRLTQQAKTHHITAGRAAANASPVSYYDRMDQDDDA